MSEAVPGEVEESTPEPSNAEELYSKLSALITKSVVNHTTNNWPNYFVGLRAVINRVLADTADELLSAEDRAALVMRLMEHITELEKAWPGLAGKLETLETEQP
jgi:hypothetical protein